MTKVYLLIETVEYRSQDRDNVVAVFSSEELANKALYGFEDLIQDYYEDDTNSEYWDACQTGEYRVDEEDLLV